MAKENSNYMNNPAELTPLSRDNIMDMLASERIDTFPLHVRDSFSEPFSFHMAKTSISCVFLLILSSLSFLILCGEPPVYTNLTSIL